MDGKAGGRQRGMCVSGCGSPGAGAKLGADAGGAASVQAHLWTRAGRRDRRICRREPLAAGGRGCLGMAAGGDGGRHLEADLSDNRPGGKPHRADGKRGNAGLERAAADRCFVHERRNSGAARTDGTYDLPGEAGGKTVSSGSVERRCRMPDLGPEDRGGKAAFEGVAGRNTAGAGGAFF